MNKDSVYLSTLPCMRRWPTQWQAALGERGPPLLRTEFNLRATWTMRGTLVRWLGREQTRIKPDNNACFRALFD